jgi:hypothetical protein
MKQQGVHTEFHKIQERFSVYIIDVQILNGTHADYQ